jgi:hypothetical protein
MPAIEDGPKEGAKGGKKTRSKKEPKDENDPSKGDGEGANAKPQKVSKEAEMVELMTSDPKEYVRLWQAND